jgi:hypothetical protein
MGIAYSFASIGSSKHQFTVLRRLKISYIYGITVELFFNKADITMEYIWMTMYAYSNPISLSPSATYQLRHFGWPHGILYRIAGAGCLPCWGTWLGPAHVVVDELSWSSWHQHHLLVFCIPLWQTDIPYKEKGKWENKRHAEHGESVLNSEASGSIQKECTIQ